MPIRLYHKREKIKLCHLNSKTKAVFAETTDGLKSKVKPNLGSGKDMALMPIP